MKKMIIAGTFAFMAIVFAACSGGTGKAESKDSGASTMATDTAGKMMAAVKYTCKMHPEVISDTPGKCAKCGMNMVKAKTFMCPMHAGEMSHKPAKCPKCGMAMVEKKKA